MTCYRCDRKAELLVRWLAYEDSSDKACYKHGLMCQPWAIVTRLNVSQ